MTREDFRRMALSLPESSERAHQGNPDFRVGDSIFATLGPKDPRFAVVKLTPEDQDVMTSSEAAIFSPLAGAWGRKGWTKINLDAADKATLKSALTTAWRTVAPKRLLK